MDPFEYIENLSGNFDKVDDKLSFMQERIAKLDKTENLNINFKECHVAISCNGGFIGICKKKGFLDIEKDSKVNDFLIIMTQNAQKRIFIPISWDYRERWIVCLDFNDNEELFGICNDGTIYKFDITTSKAELKVINRTFKDDNIEKVKFFEKGFIALTKQGIFYYIEDIKHEKTELLFPIMEKILNYSNNIDFLAIPPSHSKSGKIELLIANENKNGIIHILNQNIGNINNNSNIFKEENIKISIIFENTLVNYSKANIDGENKPNSLGKICALAISPSKKQLAFYNKEKKTVFILPSTFDSISKKASFDILRDEFSENEKNELRAILSYKEDYQFLFCGEEAVALSGQRFILLINSQEKNLIYKVVMGGELEAIQGAVFFKCISEVDGLRYITNEGVFLIGKVPIELYDSIYPFSNSPASKLLSAYKNTLENKIFSDREIRELGLKLPNAIKTLQTASANIYWLENENEGFKKEIQLYILRAAQYGKSYMQIEDFDFDEFINRCKEIRILNSLRNHPEQPRFITYNEYKKMNPDDLIKKILKQQNFSLAFRISKFINYGIQDIYQKYAMSCIKKLKDNSTIEEENNLYNQLFQKLKNIKGISYIKIAKKAFKYNKNELGLKFLGHEKNILNKIPVYIEHCEWEMALKLSYKTLDSNTLTTVIDKIVKVEDFPQSIKILSNHPEFKSITIKYFKDNKPEYLIKYLASLPNKEELISYYLENFFKSRTIKERRTYLIAIKEYLKEVDDRNFDKKFYQNYLKELENSLKFKEECMSKGKNIINQNSVTQFDNSIYDCFILGVKADNFKWIENQNKKMFNMGQKKLSFLRFKSLIDEEKVKDIEKIIEENSLRKLGLSPLNIAELFFENSQKEQAVKYIKEVKGNEYFDYKVEMLKEMEKYSDALEIIIAEGENERKANMVQDIIGKRPDLKEKAKELCTKYGTDFEIV